MMCSCLDSTDSICHNSLVTAGGTPFNTFFFSLHKIGSYHWQVPVSVSSSANPCESVASTLLDQTSCAVTVDGVKPDEWVKVCLLVPRNLASYADTLRTCHTIFLVKEHCVMSAKNVSVGGYMFP